MAREIIIYCDESDISGRHFANFYGGLLVESRHLNEVEDRILTRCDELHLRDEIKWQKISANYAEKYMTFTDELFDLAGEGKVKMRVMFTQNYFSPARLSPDQRENGFFLLYYQFIKHAFGLRYAGIDTHATRLRLLFDMLPDTREKRTAFKGYLNGLNEWRGFRNTGITLPSDGIGEIDSKNHVLLQCIDVVLGAMQFRLNDKHRDKPPGSRVRGKRTRAKEAVYKHISSRIRALYPGFNIGTSTGIRGDWSSLWNDPYRHWLFKPRDAIVKPEFGKRHKK